MPPYIEEKLNEWKGKTLANHEHFMEELKDTLISLHNHTLEEVKKCVPDRKDYESLSSMSQGLKEGWNYCRQETLEAIEKLKQ